MCLTRAWCAISRRPACRRTCAPGAGSTGCHHHAGPPSRRPRGAVVQWCGGAPCGRRLGVPRRGRSCVPRAGCACATTGRPRTPRLPSRRARCRRALCIVFVSCCRLVRVGCAAAQAVRAQHLTCPHQSSCTCRMLPACMRMTHVSANWATCQLFEGKKMRVTDSGAGGGDVSRGGVQQDARCGSRRRD
jgi:hypothetical protein